MKKSLYAVIVILLSLIGANALAAKLDKNVERVVLGSTDDSSTGNSGDRNRITKN